MAQPLRFVAGPGVEGGAPDVRKRKLELPRRRPQLVQTLWLDKQHAVGDSDGVHWYVLLFIDRCLRAEAAGALALQPLPHPRDISQWLALRENGLRCHAAQAPELRRAADPSRRHPSSL